MINRYLWLIILIVQAALLQAALPDSTYTDRENMLTVSALPAMPPRESADSIYETAMTDITAVETSVDSMPDTEKSNWWTDRIRAHTYNIADTTIQYPRFLGFCVRTYNWADRVFNTYDHEYVLPTGKKWKAIMRISNWTDSYSMTLDKMHVRMLSDIYSNVGPSVSFMAVGLSYQANLNRLISHAPARQKRYDFSFSCALFWVNAYYSRNRDGSEIRQLGHYKNPEGHSWIKYHFSDLNLENFGIDAYYFFNHGRYYHGAAYNYSKIQLKSAGSFMLGLSFSHQDISMDFTTLPHDMQAALPADFIKKFRFNYNDFGILGGYGYNWVFLPKWVANITGLGVIGYKHSLADSVEGRCERPSLNFKGRTSVAYNLHNFFTGIFASIDLNWYKSKNYSFANSIVAFGAVAGIRF